MANTARRGNRRANRRTDNRNSQTRTYLDGNAVRHVQAVPKGYPDTRQRPANTAQRQNQATANRQPVSRKARQNRAKAMGMSRGFVVFLTLICSAILFTGVQFLRMKSEVTVKAKDIAALEAELSELKADNDAYYSQVMASVDLDAIKKKAINKLGMKYPSEEQVIYYQTQRSSYVRQYQDMPGVK